MPLGIGDRVCGRYEIRHVVGARPLGVLYRAFDREIEVEVALRVIAGDLLPDDASRQAFVRQLGRSRALGHPGLLRLYDVALDGEQAVVAAQWAGGSTLREALERRHTDGQPPMDLAAARTLWQPITAAVLHAHSQGVVLGDLRPETVLLLADGVKLTNIGVGLALPRRRYLETLRATHASAHVAPEIRAGNTAEPRSDVYSLAALLVEMLSGVAPTAWPNDAPPAIAGAPAPLATVLARALTADPLLRQPTVEVLTREIELALAGRPRRRTLPPVAAPSEPERPSPPPALDGDQATRQIAPDELRQIQGQDVTRQLPADELLALRAKLSDTQQIDVDELKSEAEEGEQPGPPEELVLEAPPADEAEGRNDTERVARQANEPDDDDDDLETRRIERISLTEGPPSAAPVAATLPAGGVSPAPSPRRPTPPSVSVLAPGASPRRPTPPSVSVVPAGGASPRRPTPPSIPALPASGASPRRPTPPSIAALPASGPAPRRPTPASVALSPAAAPSVSTFPAAPAPRRPTPRSVASHPPAVAPRSRAVAARPTHPPAQPLLPAALLFGGAAILALVVVGGAALHMRTLRHLQQRAEKERLADELNARADSLRHAPVPTPPALAPASPTPAVAAAPSIAVAAAPALVAAAPILAPAPAHTDGPCPLGARLVTDRVPYCVDIYEYPGGRTIPRTAVSLAEAGRLCALRGERLCTELEWEHACRGRGGASYPYGQSFDPRRCNTGGRDGEIAAAGSFAACRSAVGAYDMSGNVAEWVASGTQKGGSTLSASLEARCSHAVRHAPVEGGVYVGFRCCGDAK